MKSEFTGDLTEYEKKQLLQPFIIGMKGHVGKANIITSVKMIEGFKSKGFKNVNGRVIRRLVHYCRVHNLLPPIMATNKGYYISGDMREIVNCISSLRGRAQSILKAADAMQQYVNEKSTGQQAHMPLPYKDN